MAEETLNIVITDDGSSAVGGPPPRETGQSNSFAAIVNALTFDLDGLKQNTADSKKVLKRILDLMLQQDPGAKIDLDPMTRSFLEMFSIPAAVSAAEAAGNQIRMQAAMGAAFGGAL